MVATDLKLCNILLGLMSQSSIHPRCRCNVDKYHLNKKGTERTFASICKLFWSYFDAQVDKSKAKDYGNVVHLPLISIQDDTTPVLHIVPPPELHLMLGPVNTLLDKMSKVWLGSEEWLNGCHVKKSEYHGSQFEENDSRKLLKYVGMLEELYVYMNITNLSMLLFHLMMQSFHVMAEIYYHSIKLV